jgi:hypothetical protein
MKDKLLISCWFIIVTTSILLNGCNKKAILLEDSDMSNLTLSNSNKGYKEFMGTRTTFAIFTMCQTPDTIVANLTNEFIKAEITFFMSISNTLISIEFVKRDVRGLFQLNKAEYLITKMTSSQPYTLYIYDSLSVSKDDIDNIESIIESVRSLSQITQKEHKKAYEKSKSLPPDKRLEELGFCREELDRVWKGLGIGM